MLTFEPHPAVDEGRQAYRDGVDYHRGNPHEENSGAWHHWRYGWRQEKDRTMPQVHRSST